METKAGVFGTMDEIAKPPVEAEQALLAARQCLGDAIVAAYLHGSAVAGGLRPQSDVDLLVVVEPPTTHEMRTRLVSALMKISGDPRKTRNRRPLELIIFRRADLSAALFPARSEFVYGEWLRDEFEAGIVPAPASDPEFTLLLAQARREAKPLIGPGPHELLPLIPEADIRRAIGAALPALLGTLTGDERNVLLTLARMWRTLATGDFVPKDVAAEWAIERLPAAAGASIAHAREAYLGMVNDDWGTRQDEVRDVADELGRHIKALLD